MPTAISIGSVSKSIWGGLRIGWIRATPSLLERVQQTRRPGTLRQLRSQRDALCEALAEHLPEVRTRRPDGGFTLWATFPEPVSSRLAAIAPDHGVTVAAGRRFGIGGAFERSIRLPCTSRPAG
ncbi:hypothetical protein [Streptomyces sp. NPDC048410]|uniref:hypothetical protein n=1 Tax=Streptomyces sp. NPDC048410 TaxID=3365545 RepID=UPI00371A8662